MTPRNPTRHARSHQAHEPIAAHLDAISAGHAWQRQRLLCSGAALLLLPLAVAATAATAAAAVAAAASAATTLAKCLRLGDCGNT